MRESWQERVGRRLRDDVPVPADFDARVLARVRNSPRGRSSRTWVLAGIAAAAAVAWALLAPRARVEFAIDLPAAGEVVVVGDFNDWDSRRTPLRRDPEGRWRAALPLAGGLYHYAFLVDGTRWVADPVRPGLPDPDFGRAISVVTVE